MQLLAALLFVRNPEGVQFFDQSGQKRRDPTISKSRDIPTAKSRFGCSIDISLAIQGYDVAYQLDKHVEAFYSGARCDSGHIELDIAALKLKTEWEFPTRYPPNLMPSLRNYRISVMYRTFSGDAELFEVSFPTAIKHIPDALEMVVVVEESDEDLFEGLLAPHRESAPFPLRVATEPTMMNGHIQQKYSKVMSTRGYTLFLSLLSTDVSEEEVGKLNRVNYV